MALSTAHTDQSKHTNTKQNLNDTNTHPINNPPMFFHRSNDPSEIAPRRQMTPAHLDIRKSARFSKKGRNIALHDPIGKQ